MAAGDPTTGPSDAELVARVRAGDTDAFGALFARHVGAARRLARALVPGPDSEDLVSEAFTRTLVVLQRGEGPDEAFRAYLLTAVRRLHVDRVRRHRRVSATDDLDDLDDGVPFVDPAVAAFEGGAAARAFASLPERWQLVLWHLEVENDKPADIAPLLDLSPNSVSALAYRAREGLRQAFVTMHHTGDPEELPEACRATRDRLGGFVRGHLARREVRKVDAHLEECLPCTGVYLELREVNSSLSGLVGPVVLGGAAAAYLSGLGVGSAATTAGAGAGAGAGSLVGTGTPAPVPGPLGRIGDAVRAQLGTAGTTVVAGTTVLAVVTGTALVVRDRTATLEAPFARQLVAERTDRPGPTGPAPSPGPTGTGGPGSGAPTGGSPGAAPADRSEAVGSATPEAPAASQDDSGGTGAPTRGPRSQRSRPAATGAGAPLQADLVLSATLGARGAERARISVTVSGVPGGRSATVAARTDGGSLVAGTPGCTGGGSTVSCTATPTRYAFVLELTAGPGTTVDLVLTPGEGLEDPVTTDNRVQLRR